MVSNEGICCVCGHKLINHLDEGEGWRCHSLGSDTYQCECYLRKDRAEGKIEYYNIEKRIEEMKKEMDSERWWEE